MWLRLALVLAAVVAAIAVLFANWVTILAWTSEAQRQAQNTMASGLRAVQEGSSLALWSLCAATFTYGFVHALGPGHGKILLGASAMASGATLRRMVGLSLISALAQSLVAIAVVGVLIGGVSVLSSGGAVGIAQDWLQPLSYALFVVIGVVILWRGVRILGQVRAAQSPVETHDHHHDHHHGHDHAHCGHAHGPTIEQVQTLQSFRDSLALVVSIAVRPCTGALLLLVIAARLDIFWAGVLGTLAMGLGTAGFNGLVAASGVMARRLAHSGESQGFQVTAGALHVVGGAVIAILSLAFLIPSF